ncbi:MAG: hypothetical protein NDI94_03970 [Candidatus Woesearchaeota archaeon]|nr:hypothetical protein [Candidatus Woesearchaeota archaeon]
MSQIEQNFMNLLGKKPEIEKCYSEGLINRRALARYLIEHKLAKEEQMDALIAMIRRYDFGKADADTDGLKDLKTSIKDNLVILNYSKEPELLNMLSKIVGQTNYNISETLKVIVGTSNVTLIVDKSRIPKLDFELLHKIDDISELSLQFSKKAINTKGIISIITRELYINDIVISEMLTASNELLIYLKDEHVLKAYELIKRLCK